MIEDVQGLQPQLFSQGVEFWLRSFGLVVSQAFATRKSGRGNDG